MKYFLYILYSSSLDRYYIGVSGDPEKRLEYHNAGKASKKAYTKRASDWGIVLCRDFNNKPEALTEEKRLKATKNRIYLESYIDKYSK